MTRFIGSYPLSQDGSLRAPSARVSLQFDVLDVFDRRFYDIACEQDYRVAPGAPVQPAGVTVHPGEPRSLRVSLDFRP